MKNIWLSWSSGKDSAFTLYELKRNKSVKVCGLITTVSRNYSRVSMHSTRDILLKKQAENLGLPLKKILIPSPCSNEIYEKKMRKVTDNIVSEGANQLAFGDLFLEDVRKYRCEKLSGSNLEPIFPIWGLNTKKLAKQIINLGFKAYLTCVDPRKLPPSFIGREFNLDLLSDFPDEIDHCGENGEFHTFVFDGPIYSEPIKCKLGEKSERDGFWFCDVIPLENP